MSRFDGTDPSLLTLPSSGTMDNITITTSLTSSLLSTMKNAIITGSTTAQSISATTISASSFITANSGVFIVRPSTAINAGITTYTGAVQEWIIGSHAGDDGFGIINGSGQEKITITQAGATTITGGFTVTGSSILQKANTQALTCTTLAATDTTDTTGAGTGAVQLSGGLAVAKSTYTSSIQFPLVNGYGTTMNFYGRAFQPIVWGGIFSATATQSVTFVRVGAIVNAQFVALSATADTSAQLTCAAGSIFNPFLPHDTVSFQIWVLDNNTSIPGVMEVYTDGHIRCALNIATTYSGTGPSGFRCTSVTWLGVDI